MPYVMTVAGIPYMIDDAILTLDTPVAIFLVMTPCLLVIGFLVDLMTAVLISTPILPPIARRWGWTPCSSASC